MSIVKGVPKVLKQFFVFWVILFDIIIFDAGCFGIIKYLINTIFSAIDRLLKYKIGMFLDHKLVMHLAADIVV